MPTGKKGLPLHLNLHGSQSRGGGASDHGDLYVYFATPAMGWRDGLPGIFTVLESHANHALTLSTRDAIENPAGNGVIVHESEFIPRASSATYNVLLGANAGSFAMGNAYPKARRSGSMKGSFFSWAERDDDYGNIMGVSAGSIFGMQAKIFDDKRLGTVTLDTECVDHQT